MARRALWTTIEDTLRQEIGSGRYRPGDKLPTEAALATRFAVNRHTVRRALSMLAEQGLVLSRRGAGVFVTHKQTNYPIGKRMRFKQNILASGRSPRRKVLLHDTRACDEAEAEALGLRVGDAVHFSENVSLVDDEPMALSRSVFPAARFPDFLQRLSAMGSITKTFQAYGIADYTRSQTSIDAKLASPTLALQLQLPQGAPLLRTISVNVDPDGVPIEFGRTWFAGDRVTLTLNAADLS